MGSLLDLPSIAIRFIIIIIIFKSVIKSFVYDLTLKFKFLLNTI